jgi:hypothetical protein
LSAQEIQASLLGAGIRIDAEMAAYVERQLAARRQGKIAILGGNARTGVPMRILVAVEKLAAEPALASQRSVV